MARRSGDDGVEVVLEDDADLPQRVARVGDPQEAHGPRWADEPPGPPAGARSGPDRATRRLLRRRGVVVGVGAVAVLGVASALFTQAETRREVAEAAAYAQLPRIAPSLEVPLRETWRSEQPIIGLVDGMALLITGTNEQRTLEAKDGATGATRWVTEVPGANRLTELQCWFELEQAERTLLACRVTAGDGFLSQNQGVPPTGPGRLVLLDVADGSVVAAEWLDSDVAGIGGIDGDLLVALGYDGRLVVRRQDAVTGAVRWSTELPTVGHPGIDSVYLTGEDGVVGVSGHLVAVLDGQDGTPLAVEADGWGGSGFTNPTSVSLAVQGFWLHDDSAPRAAWFDADGRFVRAVDGEPFEVAPSDGLPADVLLTVSAANPLPGPTLVATAAGSGDELWRRPLGPSQQALRLGGRLVVLEETALASVDVRSGEEIWTVALSRQDANPYLGGVSGIIADGRRVVLLRQEAGARARLTAYSLDSGSQLWSTLAPEDMTYVVAIEGIVLGVTPGAVVGLG